MTYKICVIGESCTDRFVYGRCKRICPEAPVPLLELSDTPCVENKGMAANVKRNIEYISDGKVEVDLITNTCLLYTSPSPRDGLLSRMPSSA